MQIKNGFVDLSSVDKRFITVMVNKSYKPYFTPFQTYECARTAWHVDLNKAQKADYILAVYHGKIVGVYVAVGWLDGYSTENSVIKSSKNVEGRYEFVGKIVKSRFAKKLIGCEILGYKKKGYPVQYFN